MQIPSEIDLSKLREKADISQSEMAERLGVSQSQVSRYEQDPDEVPYRVIRRWFALCGFVSNRRGVEIEDPFTEIHGRIKLLLDYAQTEPEMPIDNADWATIANTQAFIQGVKTVANKPRAGVFGQFSSGKSRLVNILLGLNRLPAGFEATTMATCLIRHISDKPAWQVEDVWMMRSGFDFDLADDKAHCEEHRLLAGGYEALNQYGTYTGSGSSYNALAAVVYVDAPLLLGCDLLDLPGYDLSKDDKNRPEMGRKMVDVLLYLSNVHGFINQNDLNYLNILMRHLPTYETSGGSIEPLRNLMIVATKADVIANDQIITILDSGAERVYQHLDHVITERVHLTGVPVTQEDLRRRFFSFTAVDADTRTERVALESDLIDLLTNVLPRCTLGRLNAHILSAKVATTTLCAQRINRLQMAIDEREQALAAIQTIQADEAVRLCTKAVDEQRINTLIDEFKTERVEMVATVFKTTCTVASIQNLIQGHFGEKKKEAQNFAGTYLLNTIQNEVENDLKDKANQLSDQVDLLLGGFNSSIKKHFILQDRWSFNAQAAFMADLANVGFVGALTAWVNKTGTESKQSISLLTPPEIRFFSRMGLGVGGTSAETGMLNPSWIPVVFDDLTPSALLDDSWQQKLAKRIYKQITKQKVDETIIEALESFWEGTKLAVSQAADKTELIYQSELGDLKNMVLSNDHEKLKVALNFSLDLRDFFGGLPWRVIRS